MNAKELIKKTKASVAAGRAVVFSGGKHTIIARSVDGTMTLTKEGKALADDMAPKKETKKEAPAKAEKTDTKDDKADDPAKKPDNA